MTDPRELEEKFREALESDRTMLLDVDPKEDTRDEVGRVDLR